ncbi:MAG TPA: hypothetical protein VLE23_16860 [Geminicoccaceae bacterium]|nr:hypothetical protein [Geminicoccaceae bacterium]
MRMFVLAFFGAVALALVATDPPGWVTSQELGPRTCPEGDQSCR